jgi:3-oxoacyl-[acyl-carrier protein] reductase
VNKIDLSGQIAIVTGGAQGIGFAVAKRLVESGARVASWDLAGINTEAMATLGEAAVAVPCDITDWNAVTRAFDQTRDAFGVPTIAVNSAGITGPNTTVEDYGLEDWRRVIDVNLTGTFHINRVVIPEMKAANYGRIVNIASIAGKEGNPNASAYSASKAAVIALTKSLGKETAGHDIAVNAVTPAAAKTAIFDQMTQEHINYMLSKIPRNRFLQVEEAASMIAWLVSAENSFTTGAVFDLSGGRATY